MSNNKQSSVEWFAIQLWEEMNMQGDGAVFNKLLKQAKAMHKEEIIRSWMTTDNELQRIAAEKYYNETFNKNEI